jgi:hypothetical protein
LNVICNNFNWYLFKLTVSAKKVITDKTDNQERTARTGWPVQDSHEGTAWKKDSQRRKTREGRLGKDILDRTARIGLPGQDFQDGAARTERGTARMGQHRQDCLDEIPGRFHLNPCFLYCNFLGVVI